MTNLNMNELIEKIKKGDRRSLAKAITLVESTRIDHQNLSRLILNKLKNEPKSSLKIGLTGTPGVGKSTFIETLGLQLIQKRKKVAVLAIDPSSKTTGGSILGDKTRMELLSKENNAFIRPSPNSGSLGGIAKRTREAITLCEAAGYEIILVETVGVGQSETLVSEITDVFCLLIAPAGGDELQGVKRGIMEMSDIILINKADGELKPIAKQTSAQYESALKLFRHRKYDPPYFPKVIPISSLTGAGLSQVWSTIEELISWRKQKGFFDDIRKDQKVASFNRELNNVFQEKIIGSPKILEKIKKIKTDIYQGYTTPEEGAEALIKKILH
ncbi:MAG: methylmalonyl Co-A mutase-associated GTPase MeaB [Paracoccaceae bacterium]|nr:methylmalonyl Co-A mutase-associated GTPase MeaB [Paracoccaceae bacterium]